MPKLHRVIFAPHVYVYNDAKTLGLHAARNTDKMGTYELEDKKRAQNDKSYKHPSELPSGMERVELSTKRPWYRDDKPKKKLQRATKKEKENYIKTGRI